MQPGSNRSPPRNSLLAGKRTGNFAESGPPEAIFTHNRPANSVPCSKIPYAMEQGIFWRYGLHPICLLDGPWKDGGCETPSRVRLLGISGRCIAQRTGAQA